MILVAGGTGTLGSKVVQRLTAAGLPVRVLTRQHGWTPEGASGTIDVVKGDVQDTSVVAGAVEGASVVVSCIQGFAGRDAAGTEAIDHHANALLIDAAGKAGVQHFLLVSIVGAAPESPVPLFRAKHQAEQALRASNIPFTIVRATAFMETWLTLIGDPLVHRGRTRIFGKGANPINFVAADDVAATIEHAVRNRAPSGETLVVAGPENLTFTEFVQTIQRTTGHEGKIGHTPRPMMRLVSTVLGFIKPVIAGQIRTSIAMDADDMTTPPTLSATTHLADLAATAYLNGNTPPQRTT